MEGPNAVTGTDREEVDRLLDQIATDVRFREKLLKDPSETLESLGLVRKGQPNTELQCSWTCVASGTCCDQCTCKSTCSVTE